MAVAFDATFTGAPTAGTDGFTASTSASSTKLTVGAGSNRALVVLLTFEGTTALTPPTGVSVTWDAVGANQALALINSTNDTTIAGGGHGITQQLWGLIAPVSGNKTLSLAWTSSQGGSYTAVAVTGANQAGGTTTFANANAAKDLTGLSATSSVTITSAVGDFVVAQHAFDIAGGATIVSSVNNTGMYSGLAGNIPFATAAANRAAGAATVAMTGTADLAGSWMAQGVSITAFVAAQQRSLQINQAVKRASYI